MAEYYVPWIIAALLISVAMIWLGKHINGHWFGILIDFRNKMSLSRLQIVLWTVLIVSALLAVIYEVRSVSIYLAPELWVLMAISTGSAAGAIIIKGNKSERQPSPAVAANPAIPAPPQRIGLLPVATKPRFSDMFKGEEIVDENLVDISKVQMFFFTMAAIAGYAIALAGVNLGIRPPGVTGTYCAFFPALSESLVALIGISHVGYLTVKAAPHTPT